MHILPVRWATCVNKSKPLSLLTKYFHISPSRVLMSETRCTAWLPVKSSES